MQHYSFLLVCLALLTGCSSTPTSRISKNQNTFDAYPAEIQTKIRAGEVAVGFTSEMVMMALGEPDGRSKVTTASGESEVWSYIKSRPSIGFGIGIGGGGGSTRVGSGIGIGTGGDSELKLRLVMVGGKVSTIEKKGT